MIRSTIRVFDRFPELTAAVEARTITALEEGAAAGAEIATARADGGHISEFNATPVQRTSEGFSVGIRARNPIWHVFDKGSLGKRTARLKRDRRQAAWPVSQEARAYTGHRRDVEGKGVAARNIGNPARLAGRKAIIAALKRL